MKEETTKSCVDGGERHLYQVPYEVKLSGVDSFLSEYGSTRVRQILRNAADPFFGKTKEKKRKKSIGRGKPKSWGQDIRSKRRSIQIERRADAMYKTSPQCVQLKHFVSQLLDYDCATQTHPSTAS